MSATVTDLFCGAGGSAEGAKWAGAEVKMAANHWRLAVDVHQHHHDTAAHDCVDISQVDFRRSKVLEALDATPTPA